MRNHPVIIGIPAFAGALAHLGAGDAQTGDKDWNGRAAVLDIEVLWRRRP
jgi:hypothetical protein